LFPSYSTGKITQPVIRKLESKEIIRSEKFRRIGAGRGATWVPAVRSRRPNEPQPSAMAPLSFIANFDADGFLRVTDFSRVPEGLQRWA
jgi:hypothetical protein